MLGLALSAADDVQSQKSRVVAWPSLQIGRAPLPEEVYSG